MSHELRTPLAGISSLAQNQEEGTIREPEQIRKYGSLIRKEARRLMDMLEQTLTFAATSRPAEFTEIHAQDLISDALTQQATALDQLGFTVETSVDADLPVIRGDRRALTRAVTNLVSNSIKYSNGHRWLFIRARAATGEVRITVEDRGIGLDASERDHLFEPFVRGRRAVNAQIPGSGLGLSIVRSTVEAHGGRVSLEPNAGEGVSATLYLPAQ
jgi:signal transduction histidine kinase